MDSRWIIFICYFCSSLVKSVIVERIENKEAIIIDQLRKGDEKAYKYLYDNHYNVCCHFAWQFVRDEFLAETIVGDVIFHLWSIRESLNISVSLRSYLMQSVKNRCFDYLKSECGRYEVVCSDFPADIDSLSVDSNVLGSLFERELEKEIQEAIKKLPVECRRVFVKSRFQNKKYEEIAKELGISVNTVKYHIKSALSSLRSDLSRFFIVLVLLLFSIS